MSANRKKAFQAAPPQIDDAQQARLSLRKQKASDVRAISYLRTRYVASLDDLVNTGTDAEGVGSGVYTWLDRLIVQIRDGCVSFETLCQYAACTREVSTDILPAHAGDPEARASVAARAQLTPEEAREIIQQQAANALANLCAQTVRLDDTKAIALLDVFALKTIDSRCVATIVNALVGIGNLACFSVVARDHLLETHLATIVARCFECAPTDVLWIISNLCTVDPPPSDRELRNVVPHVIKHAHTIDAWWTIFHLAKNNPNMAQWLLDADILAQAVAVLQDEVKRQQNGDRAAVVCLALIQLIIQGGAFVAGQVYQCDALFDDFILPFLRQQDVYTTGVDQLFELLNTLAYRGFYQRFASELFPIFERCPLARRFVACTCVCIAQHSLDSDHVFACMARTLPALDLNNARDNEVLFAILETLHTTFNRRTRHAERAAFIANALIADYQLRDFVDKLVVDRATSNTDLIDLAHEVLDDLDKLDPVDAGTDAGGDAGGGGAGGESMYDE